MNQLSTKQRKYIYLGGILMLLLPIIGLGMPSGSVAQTTDESEQEEGVLDRGGKLARLRTDYSLGESNLGQVDPSSATMNLVLLGLRGFAVNKLWMDAIENQDNKNWAQLRANVESIILLQPHYVEVWRYQGWNLAWNVSREWDAVTDRWYWLKEGGKFLIKGQQRNERIPEFYTSIGRVIGEKIAHADEWEFFRKYFFVDPNIEEFGGLYDHKFNLNGREDNYIEAKDWYLKGNAVEENRRSRMIRIMFRQKPAQAQIQASIMRLREGKLDETTRSFWERAFQNWTNKYENGEPGLGMYKFNSPKGWITMEARTEADLLDLKKLDSPDKFTTAEKREQIDGFQNMINYRMWRARTKFEQNPRMIEARREIAEGRELFKDSELTAASIKLRDGLERLKQFMQGPEGEVLSRDDEMIDEILMTILIWQQCLKYLDKPVPKIFPLKSIWDRNQNSLTDVKFEFHREFDMIPR